MKRSIVVCVLVVLVYHEVSCHDGPALLKGNCTPEDVPAELLGQCVKITCTKLSNGQVSRGVHACQPVGCIDSAILQSRPLDLTKSFPDCCPAVLKCA